MALINNTSAMASLSAISGSCCIECGGEGVDRLKNGSKEKVRIFILLANNL